MGRALHNRQYGWMLNFKEDEWIYKNLREMSKEYWFQPLVKEIIQEDNDTKEIMKVEIIHKGYWVNKNIWYLKDLYLTNIYEF